MPGEPGQAALHDLQTVAQPWVVANRTTVGSGGEFGLFSAVCWLFGRVAKVFIFNTEFNILSQNSGELAACETAGEFVYKNEGFSIENDDSSIEN